MSDNVLLLHFYFTSSIISRLQVVSIAYKREISRPLILRNRRCSLTATVNSEVSTAGANQDPAGIAREMYHEFRKILHISRISLKRCFAYASCEEFAQPRAKAIITAITCASHKISHRNLRCPDRSSFAK